MRVSLLPHLAVLLYIFCFDNCVSIDPNEDIEDGCLSKIVKNKADLRDLNVDCLHLIFDQLDLVSLIHMMQMGPESATIAANVFRQKYSNYMITLVKTNYNPANEKQYIINQSLNYIAINDLKLFSDIMKYFGNYIRKLSISNNSMYNYTSGSDWAIANRILNEYGSESLIQLDLGYIRKEIWPQFSLPFKKVDKLTFEISADTDGKKLNQLCPNLRDLHIQLRKDVNYDFIDCELPHLQRLGMIFDDDKIWNQKEQIAAFIKKNPQIRSVDAAYTITPFSKLISEYLRNLDYISLNFNDNYNEPTHFENVKHCVLSTWQRSSIKKLSFSHLDSLETSYFEREFDKYVEFFGRHQNLSRLHLTHIRADSIRLEEMTADLANLNEMIIEDCSGFNIEIVTAFIEKHLKLIKFQFPAHDIKETDREILQKRFERDWNIQIIKGRKDKFLFEKKKKF